jgi:hypothetical protein
MNYRLVLFTLISSVLLLSQDLCAQSRQSVLAALQTLQSRCETGIVFESYVSSLDDVQSQVRDFFESNEAGRNPDFAERIERALLAYQSAFVIWKAKLDYRQDVVSIDHPTIQTMLNVYPDSQQLFDRNGQATVTKLVSFFWDKADARIAEARGRSSGKKR